MNLTETLRRIFGADIAALILDYVYNKPDYLAVSTWCMESVNSIQPNRITDYYCDVDGKFIEYETYISKHIVRGKFDQSLCWWKQRAALYIYRILRLDVSERFTFESFMCFGPIYRNTGFAKRVREREGEPPYIRKPKGVKKKIDADNTVVDELVSDFGTEFSPFLR